METKQSVVTQFDIMLKRAYVKELDAKIKKFFIFPSYDCKFTCLPGTAKAA